MTRGACQTLDDLGRPFGCVGDPSLWPKKNRSTELPGSAVPGLLPGRAGVGQFLDQSTSVVNA